MIDYSLIARAKDVSIVAYLYSKHIIPEEHSKSAINDYAYCSPFTNEKTPSFFVNSKKNVFTDYSSSEKGDSIRLVLLLEKCTFFQAVERLLTIDGSVIVEAKNNAPERMEMTHTGSAIIDVRPVSHLALIQYIESRAIPINLAKRYVQEIHYTNNGRTYFGVGFQNDAGNWAVRSNNYQGNIGSSGITTFLGDVNSVVLFEGFFDFLSALVYQNIDEFVSTAIVLNSTTNLNNKLIENIKSFRKVYTMLDNDPTGNKAVDKLINAGCNVKDFSKLYHPYNDFNDYLIARKATPV